MSRSRSESTSPHKAGRLTALPGEVAPPSNVKRGVQPIGLADGRDGLLFVPEQYSPDRPAPLVVMLHGAGGNAHHGLAPFLPLAEQRGMVLLAPESRRETWDMLFGAWGPDVAYIDAALEQIFSRLSIDPVRIAAEGFSDGASYALSLGITNGELFRHVVAFSPGFAAPADQRGAPRIYVSHGTGDEVLPIDRCSRRFVPALKRAGYDVTYTEFEGGHTMPPEIIQAGLSWLLD
jgi:phospholipase/carboxylesterase